MMQDYEFASKPEAKSTNTSSKTAGTLEQPSSKAVQNILNFARCYQCVNIKDVKLKHYLN